METHSSYEICPEERKLLVTGYLFGPRQDVSTFRIHNLTAWCREYCELCVRLVMDVEREPQESSRMAAICSKWEAAKSLVFRWPCAASPETTKGQGPHPLPSPSLCNILAFFPFPPKV